MDDVLQHLEAALSAVESKVEESPFYQDVVNRLNDVKNRVVSVKAELEASSTEQPTPPVETPDENPEPAMNQKASGTDNVEASADQVTNEDGSAVSDPNAAR